MAYAVHSFKDGDVLTAVQLNEMDKQIATNETTGSTNAADIDSLEAAVDTKMNMDNPTGTGSLSVGMGTYASGAYSQAVGNSTIAGGANAHAEGNGTTAGGEFSHAEGQRTEAANTASHAEGIDTTAYGQFSHAEGNGTYARSGAAHAEGTKTYAGDESTHAEGFGTKASSKTQHVQGRYNIEDGDSVYQHIVGNGTSDTARSNAHTLDWSGNAEYAGDVTANGCGGENPVSLLATAQKLIDIVADDDAAVAYLNGETES